LEDPRPDGLNEWMQSGFSIYLNFYIWSKNMATDTLWKSYRVLPKSADRKESAFPLTFSSSEQEEIEQIRNFPGGISLAPASDRPKLLGYCHKKTPTSSVLIQISSKQL
jgi:hypothetical protein